MPERTIPITKCDVTWSIQDAGAANTYSPPAEVGDLAYTANLYAVTQILNRCTLYGARKSDEEPVTVTFTVHLTDPGSSTYTTLTDICEEKGWWAANATSTTASSSDVFTQDFVVTVDGSFAGIADHTLTFDDLFFRGVHTLGGDPGSLAVTGTSTTSTKPTVS